MRSSKPVPIQWYIDPFFKSLLKQYGARHAQTSKNELQKVPQAVSKDS
jgi:hypothetical protein